MKKRRERIVGAVLHIVTALASAVPALATPPLPKLTDDPITLFMLSEEPVEDRNADRKPDLWRRFNADGSLKEVSFDSSFSRGVPDLVFVFNGQKKWQSRSETFRTGTVKRITTIRLGDGAHGDRMRIETESRAGKVTSQEFEPLEAGGFRYTATEQGKTRVWEEGGEYSNLRYFENGATQCLSGDPLARLSSADVQAITREIAGATILTDSCNAGVTFNGPTVNNTPNPIRLANGAAVRNEITSIVTTGLSCLRGLKAADGTTPSHQANRLADELLANVFSDAPRRERIDSLVVGCVMPEANSKAYARSADVTQRHFPMLTMNPAALNRANYQQVIFHEMLHMTGTRGRPHIHNYSDPQAPDLCQPCAACCFAGDTSVDPAAATESGSGIADLAQLRQESCKVCAGQFTPLSRQQIAYARTELAQGNPTSSKYAAFELRKAVINEPGNREAWALLGHALMGSRPATIDRSFRALAAFRRAYSLATNDAERTAISSDPVYRALQTKLNYIEREGNTALQLRGYTDTGQARLDQTVRTAILGLEVERARLRQLVQSCQDFSSGSGCATGATAALANYRTKVQAYEQANTAVTTSTNRSPDVAVRQANQELARNARMLTCVQGGKSGNQCFMEAYGNPEPRSIAAQDWNAQP